MSNLILIFRSLIILTNSQDKLVEYFAFEEGFDESDFSIVHPDIDDKNKFCLPKINEIIDKNSLPLGFAIIDFKFFGYDKDEIYIKSDEIPVPYLLLILDNYGRIFFSYIINNRVIGTKLKIPDNSIKLEGYFKINTIIKNQNPIAKDEKSSESNILIKKPLLDDFQKKEESNPIITEEKSTKANIPTQIPLFGNNHQLKNETNTNKNKISLFEQKQDTHLEKKNPIEKINLFGNVENKINQMNPDKENKNQTLFTSPPNENERIKDNTNNTIEKGNQINNKKDDFGFNVNAKIEINNDKPKEIKKIKDEFEDDFNINFRPINQKENDFKIKSKINQIKPEQINSNQNINIEKISLEKVNDFKKIKEDFNEKKKIIEEKHQANIKKKKEEMKNVLIDFDKQKEKEINEIEKQLEKEIKINKNISEENAENRKFELKKIEIDNIEKRKELDEIKEKIKNQIFKNNKKNLICNLNIYSESLCQNVSSFEKEVNRLKEYKEISKKNNKIFGEIENKIGDFCIKKSKISKITEDYISKNYKRNIDYYEERMNNLIKILNKKEFDIEEMNRFILNNQLNLSSEQNEEVRKWKENYEIRVEKIKTKLQNFSKFIEDSKQLDERLSNNKTLNDKLEYYNTYRGPFEKFNFEISNIENKNFNQGNLKSSYGKTFNFNVTNKNQNEEEKLFYQKEKNFVEKMHSEIYNDIMITFENEYNGILNLNKNIPSKLKTVNQLKEKEKINNEMNKKVFCDSQIRQNLKKEKGNNNSINFDNYINNSKILEDFLISLDEEKRKINKEESVIEEDFQDYFDRYKKEKKELTNKSQNRIEEKQRQESQLKLNYQTEMDKNFKGIFFNLDKIFGEYKNNISNIVDQIEKNADRKSLNFEKEVIEWKNSIIDEKEKTNLEERNRLQKYEEETKNKIKQYEIENKKLKSFVETFEKEKKNLEINKKEEIEKLKNEKEIAENNNNQKIKEIEMKIRKEYEEKIKEIEKSKRDEIEKNNKETQNLGKKEEIKILKEKNESSIPIPDDSKKSVEIKPNPFSKINKEPQIKENIQNIQSNNLNISSEQNIQKNNEENLIQNELQKSSISNNTGSKEISGNEAQKIKMFDLNIKKENKNEQNISNNNSSNVFENKNEQNLNNNPFNIKNENKNIPFNITGNKNEQNPNISSLNLFGNKKENTQVNQLSNNLDNNKQKPEFPPSNQINNTISNTWNFTNNLQNKPQENNNNPLNINSNSLFGQSSQLGGGLGNISKVI